MKQFLLRRWFLLALALVLAVGFAFSAHLAEAAARFPRAYVLAAVLFCMAFPLDIRAMWTAISRPGPALLAVAINFGLVPPLAFLVAPVLPSELATGLIVIAAIPCTLASAVVWTRRAGGNDAVAILVTMITNLACFLVTPAWLQVLTKTSVAIDLLGIVSRLGLLVVLPIVVAQLLRLSSRMANFATTHKLGFGVAAQLGILTMVLLGAIRSGVELAHNSAPETGGSTAIAWHGWLLMLAAVVAVHMIALLVGHALAGALGMERPERIAVGFAGSQKTLAVGLDLGLEFYGGLTILPMVAYHVSQLLCDTLVADRLRRSQTDGQQSESVRIERASAR